MVARRFGRRRRSTESGLTEHQSAGSKSAVEVADDIRATIVRLDAQRTAAARLAGRALVNQVEVHRACREQLRVLADAAGEARRGEVLANRAADGTTDTDRAEARDVEAFQRTAAGLHTVQEALDLAAEPVRALLADARDNAARASEVLARARDAFDEQVRAQVRLLVALERAERARLARAARRRPGG